MIIGNGLLASICSKVNNEDCIIFASGVSNSKEQNDEEFNRELSLLIKYIYTDKKLIYFSTCSIEDYSLTDTKYIKHKLKIEELIKNACNKYVIFRLPIVIGKCNNPNTFFNFFKYKILNNEPFEVLRDSHRYIITSDSLSTYIDKIIPLVRNKVINIVDDKNFNIIDIISHMELLLKNKAIYTVIDGGTNYKINNSYIKLLLGSDYVAKTQVADYNLEDYL
jgi:hypothetical protein